MIPQSQVSAESLLYASQGQCPEMLSSHGFPQSCRVGQAFCTHMLAVCKGSCSWSMRTHRDPATRRGVTGSVERVHGSVWGSTDDIPSSLWAGFLMESREEVSRICIPLILSEPWFLCSLPLPSPQPYSSPQYSRCSGIEASLLGNIPHGWGR